VRARPGDPAVKVLVIGAGPAGISAALQARELGAEVVLLEAEQVGGTNVNRGPAPVRTLARAARLVRDWSSWDRFGLRGPRPTLDLDAVLANSDRVAHHAHDTMDIAGHLRHLGVDLTEHLGPVRFTDPHTVRAEDGGCWRADRIVIAVGGHAAPLPVPGGRLALGYDDIHTMKALPDEVLVVGGADTGCQIASILEDFGVTVSLFEAAPTLPPAADPSVSVELGDAFRAQGMNVYTGTVVKSLRAQGDAVCLDYRSGPVIGQLVADTVFFAVGWPANLSHLALDAAGVHTEPGVIRRRVHGRRLDRRADRRTPARVPHLHRGDQHGRAEDLPGSGHRAFPAGLELPRIRRLTKRSPEPGPRSS